VPICREVGCADDPIQIRAGWAMDVDGFYDHAGVGPADIDFVQAYDDYPVICFMQIEDLGFCPKGEAAVFVREHDLTTAGEYFDTLILLKQRLFAYGKPADVLHPELLSEVYEGKPKKTCCLRGVLWGSIKFMVERRVWMFSHAITAR
jgi:hypothetical protein